MEQQFLITHYYHSGFSIAWRHDLFVFDYWRGDQGELFEEAQLTEKELSAYRKIYVFITHDHVDHLDSIVFSWRQFAEVQYIVSSDMPIGIRGKRMAPGDSLELSEDVRVTAFDSTDLGVSFLLDLGGFRFFHAGDLNFWHWREESTMQEIQEAEEDFHRAVLPIQGEAVDIAFFPVDPRQGAMFEAGADYFILSVKPRLLIPMHYFDQTEVIQEYARRAATRSTQVLAMTEIGEQIQVQVDEAGYMNISWVRKEQAEETEEESSGEALLPLEDEDNPFDDSDLPVPQLMSEEEAPPPGGEPG